MRNASIACLRKIAVETGGSNVQFAINPKDGRMVIIEMNPRVSRSSALASKATGFPIAKVAAKLAVGFTLDELGNDITGGKTQASFEPSIDYVVTKIPRFAFEKFPKADDRLTTQMKSVGEVMAIGSSFQESLQKALRGLEIDMSGLDPIVDLNAEDARNKIRSELISARDKRIFYIADAFRFGMTIEEVFDLSKVDRWFLAQIEDLVSCEMQINGYSITDIDTETMMRIERKGFSDSRLAALFCCTEQAVRERRRALNIQPVFKRVDSCAAEFDTQTAYLY
jgi:carbamoyl-phosphate synthase large subunit